MTQPKPTPVARKSKTTSKAPKAASTAPTPHPPKKQPKATHAKASPSPAAVPKVPAPKDTRSKRRQLVQKLARNLTGLRAALAEAVDQFEMKVQGRLASAQTLLEGQDGGLPALPLSTLERARKAVADLHLKPQKGRLKDLEALAEAASKLQKVLAKLGV